MMTARDDSAHSMGKRVMERLDTLATLTETPGSLTRRFLTRAHADAMAQVARWMREAGMVVHNDPIGNVIGRIEGAKPGAAALVLGSHIDTVADAGKYDGNLGVVAAIEAAAALSGTRKTRRHAIEVVAFGDEEGVRFPSHLLSSRALSGSVRAEELEAADARGVSVANALRSLGFAPERIAECTRTRDEIAAYLEVHIEQGPVLQAKKLPLAAVTAVNGATRMRVFVTGVAGHAGTVPMTLRRDALAAAAEMILAVEAIGTRDSDLVATVGRLEVRPGAPNVVPGAVSFTVDVRSSDDKLRVNAVANIKAEIERIAGARGLAAGCEIYYDSRAAAMDRRVVAAVAAGIEAVGETAIELSSGAGHDAMVIAPHWPAGMMFVRCKDGVSHNPAEAITLEDADVAVKALIETVRLLDQAF